MGSSMGLVDQGSSTSIWIGHSKEWTTLHLQPSTFNFELRMDTASWDFFDDGELIGL